MTDVKEIVEFAGSAVTIISGIAALIIFFNVQKNKKLPLKRSNDGYYYDKKGKRRYCPVCYESEHLRNRIIDEKCTKCNKDFRTSSIVIEIVKPKGINPRFKI